MFVDVILNWLYTWSEVIAGLGSILLTTGLVVLYAKQYGILKRELNRDVREQHTETLRTRIHAWHGDLEEVGQSDEIIMQDAMNLPSVNAASVTPAPPVMVFAGEDPEFRVVPEAIEDDLYLKDLLENNAPELRKLKGTIEDQNKAFNEAKESFVEAFDGGEVREGDGYTLRPKDRLAGWVFAQTVKLHRQNWRIRGEQHRSNQSRLKNLAETRLQAPNYVNSSEGKKYYSPENKDSGPSTYEVLVTAGDFDEYEEIEESVVQDLEQIHFELIDEIDADGIYEFGVEGAQALDEMAESVEDLRAKLVEYEGHPLYWGDCEYLKEASI